MKKLATTLTALVIATGLTVSAQAATKVTTTTKSTTTHKNVASAKAKPQKATQKSTKASKNTHSTKASAKAKKGSKATPTGLMQYLIALERGLVVDYSSSLEIKRLLYITDRRIRYAAAPQLENAALFFKSGSLYKCKTEPGFDCKKYMGNERCATGCG